MAAIAAVAASPMTQLALGAVSVAGTLAAGAAQRRQYEEQARQARIRGRSEAIAYKQKGADALRNLNETLAAITARSAAGGVDPTSGSARTIAEFAQGEGIRESNMAADNAIMALGQASSQAFNYRQAGYTAQLTSYVQAAGTIGQYAYQYGQLT